MMTPSHDYMYTIAATYDSGKLTSAYTRHVIGNELCGNFHMFTSRLIVIICAVEFMLCVRCWDQTCFCYRMLISQTLRL
jgi:hypothetical protein